MIQTQPELLAHAISLVALRLQSFWCFWCAGVCLEGGGEEGCLPQPPQKFYPFLDTTAAAVNCKGKYINANARLQLLACNWLPRSLATFPGCLPELPNMLNLIWQILYLCYGSVSKNWKGHFFARTIPMLREKNAQNCPLCMKCKMRFHRAQTTWRDIVFDMCWLKLSNWTSAHLDGHNHQHLLLHIFPAHGLLPTSPSSGASSTTAPIWKAPWPYLPHSPQVVGPPPVCNWGLLAVPLLFSWQAFEPHTAAPKNKAEVTEQPMIGPKNHWLELKQPGSGPKNQWQKQSRNQPTKEPQTKKGSGPKKHRGIRWNRQGVDLRTTDKYNQTETQAPLAVYEIGPQNHWQRKPVNFAQEPQTKQTDKEWTPKPQTKTTNEWTQEPLIHQMKQARGGPKIHKQKQPGHEPQKPLTKTARAWTQEPLTKQPGSGPKNHWQKQPGNGPKNHWYIK